MQSYNNPTISYNNPNICKIHLLMQNDKYQKRFKISVKNLEISDFLLLESKDEYPSQKTQR